MRVRPAKEEDCAALGRGMKAVIEEGTWLATEPPVSATELADRYRASVADDIPPLILEDGGELVGCLSLSPTRADGVLGLGMWILAGWRGRGGGRMLVEAALAARPPDVHKIVLEVFPENEAAVGLYETMGFEREGLLRDHYRRRDGSLRSALIMGRLFETG